MRRAFGMAPISLTDEGIERIERLAATPALELLEALPADQREAVRAHILNERPYTEIARELHCSPSVRKRVSRGVRAMRSKLEASGDE
jgi:RNA polymerase sigma-70 factor (ECF subfamily)